MYQTPEKLGTKKKLEIVAIIVGIIWAITLLINYINYTNNKPLLLAIHTTKEYDDGYVEEYISLGYIYRIYNRTSIAREELVPFWIPRENPESEPDLPKVKVFNGDDIPANPQRQDRFRGLLYFYNRKRELLGVYNCVNSNGKCSKAFAGWDKYNTSNKDALTKIDETLHTIDIIHDKYAFVDDSVPQESKYGDSSYQRIIYLYQFNEGEEHIIAKYSDIKESAYDKDRELATGDSNRFIVRDYDSPKWGVISISESGEIKEELPFEYESIDYDEDTKYYILCKDEKWKIYDLREKKQVSEESTDPIYNVWSNNNLTYYYKTGKDRYINDYKTVVDYKVYRLEDNKVFLDTPHVTEIIEKPNCLVYITEDDNILHFYDYGKVERYKIQLAFSDMHHNELTHPAFQIWRESDKYMTLRIYKGRELGNDYDTETVNLSNWEANY